MKYRIIYDAGNYYVEEQRKSLFGRLYWYRWRNQSPWYGTCRWDYYFSEQDAMDAITGTAKYRHEKARGESVVRELFT